MRYLTIASARLLLIVLASLTGLWAQAGKAGPASLYPDPDRTPGMPNPNITQDNIGRNICSKKWSTKNIRPPSNYTTNLKKKEMKDWGLKGKTGDYEEDHFISLENGGDPQDPKNLWPEPYNTKVNGKVMGAKQKDLVEGYIHDEICFDVRNHKVNSKKYKATKSVTLADGQRILANDWYACYLDMVAGKPCE